MDNVETVDKMESKETETLEADWESIIEDAKIRKCIDLTWENKKIRLFYKELIGPEDTEIDKRIGNNESAIILEKTYMMIVKANKGGEAPSDMTREKWNAMPARLRNLIIYKIMRGSISGMSSEDFQNLPEVPVDNS